MIIMKTAQDIIDSIEYSSEEQVDLNITKIKRQRKMKSQLRCLRSDCGHSWLQKFPNKIPVCCPKCKSYEWNNQIKYQGGSKEK